MRIAIAGCGAVTRLYAAPALARMMGSGEARITALYDPDPSSVEAVRRLLGGVPSVPSLEAAIADAEVVVVASPPAAHAGQVIAALRSGVHVFCEKPLALTTADADRMIAASENCGRMLTVGMIRRQLPAARAVGALIRSGAIGQLQSIDWFEGGRFEWPIASPQYFTFRQSGGGVLQDIGSHVLDLLAWWCGPLRLVSYEDDAMGGVEANALACLEANGTDISLRLSRDWSRPDQARIIGDAGTIVWRLDEPLHLELDLAEGSAGRVILNGSKEGATDFVWAYVAQLRAFFAAVRSGHTPDVPAAAGRDACALVEACYRSRRPIDMPWFTASERAKAADLQRTGQ